MTDALVLPEELVKPLQENAGAAAEFLCRREREGSEEAGRLFCAAGCGAVEAEVFHEAVCDEVRTRGGRQRVGVVLV